MSKIDVHPQSLAAEALGSAAEGINSTFPKGFLMLLGSPLLHSHLAQALSDTACSQFHLANRGEEERIGLCWGMLTGGEGAVQLQAERGISALHRSLCEWWALASGKVCATRFRYSLEQISCMSPTMAKP